MKIDNPQRIAFLRNIHLFRGLSEEQIEAVAGALHEEEFAAQSVIIKEGGLGDRFYLIFTGRVRVTKEGYKDPLAILLPGDSFGEMALSGHRHRTATVTAEEDILTFVISHELYRSLIKQAPLLRRNFDVTIASYRLARKMQFKWIQKDEFIFFLTRKHPFLLWRALTPPVTLAMLVVLFFPLLLGLIPHQPAVPWVTGGILVVLALWGLWKWIDWGNDYYIVTNRRVVWLEKVVGIYDSRQEAPLSAIQRINVLTDFWGRQMDYGNLIVRTIVGTTLTLRNVNHPYQAAALIEEHWRRSRETSNKMEEAAIRQALRARLLPNQQPAATVKNPNLVTKPPTEKTNPYKGQRRFGNLFRLRFEEFAIVTYRKHLFVLVEQTWIPSLILVLMISLLIYGIVLLARSSMPVSLGNIEVGALFGIWLMSFIIILLWWTYQYVDWSNDIFQVTPDQILDIDKTPLGEVTSDIAALDNILSIEYERKGLLQLLFNYGTVYITVGGGKQMTFHDVFNPSNVQEDIERRRLERIAKIEADRVKAERDRMADWFAAYHHNSEAIRREEGKQTPGENEVQ